MPKVTTTLGAIAGVAFDGYERYAGIPYAAPPVGDRRFRAPEPVDPWSGVLDGTTFGASAIQPPQGGVVIAPTQSEDCLFLNVYTPNADGRRPVMVWIHGGAYITGSGDAYDGRSFCRQGDVVVVTINYRLGALGFLPVDDMDGEYRGAANNGIRDQILALRWVHDHISDFGGDPDNVTVFGESAGGGSVFALLAAPEADGLFHKAISESGPAGFAPLKDAGDVVSSLLQGLGRPDGGLEALRGASADELLAAQQVLAAAMLTEPRSFDRGLRFGPAVDGVVIPQTVPDALAAKGDRNVPLIAGTNRDEGTLFTLLGSPEVAATDLRAALGRVTNDPDRVLEAYGKLAAESGRALSVELTGDHTFRISTLRAVDAQVTAGQVPAWVYMFTWPTPALGGQLGATHALEIAFAWNLLDEPGWQFLVGGNPPAVLAQAMHRAWIAFARHGDPSHDGLSPWDRYDTARRPTMLFDVESRCADDPLGDARASWS